MAFDDQNVVQSSMLPPLPERMRPKDLAGYVGQTHLVGEGCILRNMITSGNLSSFILWGPPGVGKTTLAGIIASSLHRDFYTLSAVSAGVKDVRDVIDRAKGRSVFSQGAAPILFIDEIHRFNKAQQDALLGAVENGTIVLIGATTENPSFEVITPLLSRCQVFVLRSLDVEDLQVLLDRALTTDVLLKEKDIEVKESEALFRFSGGDARKLLNVLEISFPPLSSRSEARIQMRRSITLPACLTVARILYSSPGACVCQLLRMSVWPIQTHCCWLMPVSRLCIRLVCPRPGFRLPRSLYIWLVLRRVTLLIWLWRRRLRR